MITYEYTKIEPTVVSYRGYENFIIRLTVGMTAIDENGNSEYYEETHALDTEKVFTLDSPFIPFNEMTREQVLSMCDHIAEVGHFKVRLQEKLNGLIPKLTKFSWQE